MAPRRCKTPTGGRHPAEDRGRKEKHGEEKGLLDKGRKVGSIWNLRTGPALKTKRGRENETDEPV